MWSTSLANFVAHAAYVLRVAQYGGARNVVYTTSVCIQGSVITASSCQWSCLKIEEHTGLSTKLMVGHGDPRSQHWTSVAMSRHSQPSARRDHQGDIVVFVGLAKERACRHPPFHGFLYESSRRAARMSRRVAHSIIRAFVSSCS
jgi:hypothetical protein